MVPLARAVHPLLYRPHIENGASVAAGVALAGLAVGLWLGLASGIVAATGALCVSIADQPDPLSDKPRWLFAALIMAAVTTVLTLLAKDRVWSIVAVTALIGMWAGLLSAYGRRAIGLGVVVALAFVWALAANVRSILTLGEHTALFALGGAFYASYALLFAHIFDSRVRRLLLAEALRGFAIYLRAKADALTPGGAIAPVIEAHAAAVEQMQAARDAIYVRTAKPWQHRQARALIALLDAFETILSSDADIEILQRSTHQHLLHRLRGLTLALAGEVDRLALAPAEVVETSLHQDASVAIAHEIARILPSAASEEALQEIAAFRSTADKLAQSAARIAKIGAEDPPQPQADLSLFRQPQPRGLQHLRANIGLGKSAFRYAIRLTLAMLAGLSLTLVFPNFAHAGWILLTIALIMRANYSVTRRRRWDRIVGTLIGCVAAAVLQAYVPTAFVLVFVALAIGTAHAFGAVNYRVTAASASVSSLLLLHFLEPHAHFALGERIGDTLIGAAISYLFGFLLPSWERSELPKTVAALLKADREFVAAALTRRRVEETYRLARKRLFDAVATLHGAIRRAADEPNTKPDQMARLNALLAANYLLMSDLTSMQVLYAMRGAALDKVATSDAFTDEMRARVLAILGGTAPAKIPPRLARVTREDLFRADAMAVLKRRLIHIEHAALRVAGLAKEVAL